MICLHNCEAETKPWVAVSVPADAGLLTLWLGIGRREKC